MTAFASTMITKNRQEELDRLIAAMTSHIDTARTSEKGNTTKLEKTLDFGKGLARMLETASVASHEMGSDGVITADQAGSLEWVVTTPMLNSDEYGLFVAAYSIRDQDVADGLQETHSLQKEWESLDEDERRTRRDELVIKVAAIILEDTIEKMAEAIADD